MFFGGAAGGGKTDWLLYEALEYVDVPSYSGILFRESLPNLEHEPDGIIPRLRDWLSGTGAEWSARTRTWKFPSGATITLGYLFKPDDHYRYAGPSYQFIGFDEATEIRFKSYQFMFSRLRRLHDGQGRLPLRVRAASNPGGRSHAAFRDRFQLHLGGPTGAVRKQRAYIPSLMTDNPYLDQAAYRESLAQLDPVTRARLEAGDWSISEAGNLFRAHWFQVTPDPPPVRQAIRCWDLAASVPTDSDPDPDWTAGVLYGETEDGQYVVLDVNRFRATPKGVEDQVRATAERDGRNVPIYIEVEPGASGKSLVDQYARGPLRGWQLRGVRPTGSKVERAKPVSSIAERGDLYLKAGPWTTDLIEELVIFPQDDAHDDQVDALSLAHFVLTRRPEWKVY